MNKAIFQLDALTFLRRGSAWVAMLLIMATIFYVGWNGDSWRDARAAELQSFEAEKLGELAQWRQTMEEIERGELSPTPFDGNPMSILFPAVLPPAPLSDFAIGHSDIQPQSAEVSAWRNPANLFGHYQFENPATLAVGGLDLTLVIVLLMPILMIAISFDVLAADRSRGTLPMMMSFPLRLASVAWPRLLLRNGILWFTAVVAMFVLLVVNDSGGERYAHFGIWLAVCLAYGAFWLSLIALSVSAIRSAVGTAAALIGAWAVLTLAVPAMISTGSESLYPTPSRLAWLSEVREAQGETNRELDRLTEGFLMDHPDLTVSEEQVPSYFRGSFLANEAARQRTAPILAGYEKARSDRQHIVDLAQYLSPAVIAQRLLHVAAGADLGRQHSYQSQARESLSTLAETIGPAVISRNRISMAEFEELQPFQFKEKSTAELVNSALWPLLYLLLLSALLSYFAQRRLATSQPEPGA